MTFGTVAILGPGLIGGSIALALRERSLADKLALYARSKKALDEIRQSGLAAELTGDPCAAVREADLVILCVPIEAMAPLAAQIAGALKPSALVTDVGSVKASVCRELEPLLAGHALWIGSHPMAGSEMAGFSAARADLFADAAVILTPTRETPPEAERRATQFWQALGGRITCLAPELHDDCVAQISHLPHLLAAELVVHASEQARRLAGGGFRDTTRIASGSPELWVEILQANRQAVARHLDGLIGDLRTLQAALDANPPDTTLLLSMLKNAQDARAQIPAKRNNPS
jgi:prephenate dehydrogenase